MVDDSQLKTIMDLIRHWSFSEKVGNIQINFFKGGITTVNLNETKKLPDVQLSKGKGKT